MRMRICRNALLMSLLNFLLLLLYRQHLWMVKVATERKLCYPIKISPLIKTGSYMFLQEIQSSPSTYIYTMLIFFYFCKGLGQQVQFIKGNSISSLTLNNEALEGFSQYTSQERTKEASERRISKLPAFKIQIKLHKSSSLYLLVIQQRKPNKTHRSRLCRNVQQAEGCTKRMFK